MDRPKITHVAIRFQGTVYSLPAPNRHHDVMRHIAEATGVDHVDSHGDDQGFLDESGRFLTRKQAVISAVINEQIEPGCLSDKLGALYSEDLW